MTTQTLVRIPDLGGATDVEIIELSVAIGDVVQIEQPLLTLEGDKATMEVPAPMAGRIVELRVKLGDRVSMGSEVALLESAVGDGPAVALPQSASAPAPAAPPVAAEAAPVVAQSASATPPVTTPVVDSTPAAPAVATAPTATTLPHASPAIRLYARELGVDLSRVAGSGRSGRITREDVNRHVKAELTKPAPSAAASQGGGSLNLLPWPNVDFARFGPIEKTPLSKIKKLSGQNLARNWVLIPHVTHQDEADITEMEAFRKAIQGEQKELKITPLVFLMKAAVAALKRHPTFNAALDPDGEQLVLRSSYHLGIAVDTKDGLVVPVVRDVDQKGLLALAEELATISTKARDKKLAPGDMQGATFTISSLGGIGGTGFTPIVNAPEVAILGVCRAAMKPLWDGAQFVPRLMLPLSLSYDHRVIDGAQAARFVAYMAQQLTDLRRLLL